MKKNILLFLIIIFMACIVSGVEISIFNNGLVTCNVSSNDYTTCGINLTNYGVISGAIVDVNGTGALINPVIKVNGNQVFNYTVDVNETNSVNLANIGFEYTSFVDSQDRSINLFRNITGGERITAFVCEDDFNCYSKDIVSLDVLGDADGVEKSDGSFAFCVGENLANDNLILTLCNSALESCSNVNISVNDFSVGCSINQLDNGNLIIIYSIGAGTHELYNTVCSSTGTGCSNNKISDSNYQNIVDVVNLANNKILIAGNIDVNDNLDEKLAFYVCDVDGTNCVLNRTIDNLDVNSDFDKISKFSSGELLFSYHTYSSFLAFKCNENVSYCQCLDSNSGCCNDNLASCVSDEHALFTDYDRYSGTVDIASDDSIVGHIRSSITPLTTNSRTLFFKTDINKSFLSTYDHVQNMSIISTARNIFGSVNSKDELFFYSNRIGEVGNFSIIKSNSFTRFDSVSSLSDFSGFLTPGIINYFNVSASSFGNLYFESLSVNATSPNVVLSVNAFSNHTIAIGRNQSSIFNLSMVQDQDINSSYTISSNENSSFISSVTFNETSISLVEQVSKSVLVTVNASDIVGNQNFSIILTRTFDNQTFNLSVYLTVSDSIAILTISPTTLWSQTINEGSSVTHEVIVSNTGFNASGCDFIASNGLNTFLSSNISDFSLITNESKSVLLSATPSASLYSGNVLLTCSNATDSGDSVNSNTFPYLILVNSVSAPVGGGGGGGTVDLAKKDCDLEFNPRIISFTEQTTLLEVEIVNNDIVSYQPIFGGVIDVSGDIASNVEITNTISTILPLKSDSFGLKYDPLIFEVGEATLTLTSLNCEDEIITIRAVQGILNIGAFEDLFSGDKTLIELLNEKLVGFLNIGLVLSFILILVSLILSKAIIESIKKSEFGVVLAWIIFNLFITLIITVFVTVFIKSLFGG